MKHLLFLILFSCCITAGKAQVFYHDISPDITLTGSSSRSIRIDTVLYDSLKHYDDRVINISSIFGSTIEANAYSNCQVVSVGKEGIMWDGDYPVAFIDGELINASRQTWVDAEAQTLNHVGLKGNWIGVTNAFLAVRIKKNSKWHYGWVRMDINQDGSSVTIKDYACNMKPDEPIRAGQKNTTAVHPGPGACYTNVWPNPAADLIHIDPALGLEGGSCTLYEITGRKVMTLPVTPGGTVDLAGLAAGMYAVELVKGNAVYRSRISVTRD